MGSVRPRWPDNIFVNVCMNAIKSLIGASVSKPHTSESNCKFFIGANSASPTLVVKMENCLYIYVDSLMESEEQKG